MKPRRIVQSDRHIITEMLDDLNAESQVYGAYPRDYDYVMDNLQSMIAMPQFIGIIDVDYRGFILGAEDMYWFTPIKAAHEMLLYVAPEHRGGTLAARLVKAFEADAVMRGCAEVRAGASTGINEERTIQLYERMGYTRFATPVRKVL